jgi:hypothetical protein
LIKKLLMLRRSPLAFAEPDVVLKYSVDMDHGDASISKTVFMVGAAWTTGARMPKSENITQIA